MIRSGTAQIPFSALGARPDELVLVADAQVTQAGDGPVLALAVWDAAYQPPLYLVSNLADAEGTVQWYRRRATIATFFSDQKSRGFRLDKSHLSEPARLAARLAYLWLIYLGAIARRDEWNSIIHRTDWRGVLSTAAALSSCIRTLTCSVR